MLIQHIPHTDFAGQAKLSLSAQINYRGNFQDGKLKSLRRNKWTTALKLAMASLQIYGPDGAGNPSPPPADPLLIVQKPYAPVEKEDVARPTKDDVLRSGAEVGLQDPAQVFEDEAGIDSRPKV